MSDFRILDADGHLYFVGRKDLREPLKLDDGRHSGGDHTFRSY